MSRNCMTVTATCASLLFLAACASTPVGQSTTSEAQSATERICGFRPAASSVAALAATFAPSIGGAADLAIAIAGAVCDSLAKRPLAEGPLVVRGVRVEGQYTSRRRR